MVLKILLFQDELYSFGLLGNPSGESSLMLSGMANWLTRYKKLINGSYVSHRHIGGHLTLLLFSAF